MVTGAVVGKPSSLASDIADSPASPALALRTLLASSPALFHIPCALIVRSWEHLIHLVHLNASSESDQRQIGSPWKGSRQQHSEQKEKQKKAGRGKNLELPWRGHREYRR